MNCERVREDLPRFLSGELPDGERTEIATHLKGCIGCAAEHDAIAETLVVLGTAPLLHEPPADLEARVLERVALEPLGRLVARAPIEALPPDDLERRSLERAGVLLAVGGNRTVLQRAVAPGLAAAVVALGFFGMQWRNDVQEMTQQFGPPGETLQQVSFVGPSPFPEGGGAELEVVRYDQNEFGVVIEARQLPVCRVNYHYEVWASGDQGDAYLGSFKMPGKDVYNFPMGLDPADFDEIQITHELEMGDPMKNGDLLWEAPLP
ncbi:MAG: hypothetical protein GEU71_12670 [Actinobacteria bacterium]|nr:hypothetical protein [Actinomycetota bacterium]